MPGGAAVRLDGAPVGEQLAGVVEDDDAVTQSAPPLLGVCVDDTRYVSAGLVSCWALWLVIAHDDHLLSS